MDYIINGRKEIFYKVKHGYILQTGKELHHL
jgi:hypothetical protein